MEFMLLGVIILVWVTPLILTLNLMRTRAINQTFALVLGIFFGWLGVFVIWLHDRKPETNGIDGY